MTDSKHLEFQKARFDYCKEIYYKLIESKEKLENKAKILLSLIGLFLSAIILNLQKIEELKRISLNNNSSIMNQTIMILFLVAGFCYLISLVCIFLSLKIRSFDEIYPEKLSEKFLFKGSDYFINEDNDYSSVTDRNILNNFYYTMTFVITHSIEKNSQLLQSKAKWFDYSWYSLLVTIFLICLISIIVII